MMADLGPMKLVEATPDMPLLPVRPNQLVKPNNPSLDTWYYEAGNSFC